MRAAKARGGRHQKEDEMRCREEPPDRWGSFIWGLGLIAVGVVFLLHFLKLLEWGTWKVWWPALVIFLGVMRLASARRPRSIGNGVTLLGMGGWFLFASNGWYGLDWRNSWPLALVAVGLGTVVRAIAGAILRPFRREEEPEIDALP